jgi:predicted Zn-dependent peptidase
MNEIHTERSERFGEEFHRVTFPSGLRLWFLPRPGFIKKVAILAVHFGSIHDAFRREGEDGVAAVPAGSAHFLEHRVFETENGDAFDLFERLGASANAGTGHTNTTFFFTCTDNFYESLPILLGFLGPLGLTDEMVDRERRIIVQEILSYRDSPDWQGFTSLLDSLYPTHPVRLDIAGTAESVAGIDRSILLGCHQTFYTPPNVDLVISGDLDMSRLCDFVGERHGGDALPRPEPVVHAKETGVRHRLVRRFMPVPRTHFFLGFRDDETGLEGEALFRRNMATNFFHYALFGTTSEFYRRFYGTGLIDETFSSSYRGESDFAYSVFSAETERPEELRDAILAKITLARREGLDDSDLGRAVRRMKGRFYKAFNSPEASAFSLLAYALRGISLFSFGSILDSLSRHDVEARLRDHCDTDRLALSVVDPMP